MLIRDLLTYPTKLSTIDAPIITDINPFEFQDALLEAEFLDVLIDSRRQIVGVLLEFRTALQFQDGIAGLYGRHETKPYFSWISCAVSDMIGTCRLRSPGKKPPS